MPFTLIAPTSSDLCIRRRRVESELSCLGTFSSGCESVQEGGPYRSDLKMALNRLSSYPIFLFLSSFQSVCASYLHNASSREPRQKEGGGKRDWLIGGAGRTRRAVGFFLVQHWWVLLLLFFFFLLRCWFFFPYANPPFSVIYINTIWRLTTARQEGK